MLENLEYEVFKRPEVITLQAKASANYGGEWLDSGEI